MNCVLLLKKIRSHYFSILLSKLLSKEKLKKTNINNKKKMQNTAKLQA